MHKDVIPAAIDGALSVEPELIRSNRAASKADETKRALAKNWERFAAWCTATGATPLPATPAAVEAYLVYLADRHPVRDRAGRVVRRGLKPSAVAQALWAVNLRHRLAHLPPPGDSEQVRTALAGIRRRKGIRRKQQAPLTIDHIRGIAFRADLKGLRDKALLLVGFAGCFRRSELVALRAEDLEETPHGLRALVGRSKTDQEGRGVWVDIVRATRHPDACPVQALRAWLEAAGITEGPLFRSLTRGARPRIGPALSAVTVDTVVKWAAEQCGLDRRLYGGHSLRAGKATYLAQQGRPATVIAKHGRWKSLDMVLHYYRDETARELVGVY